jgi:type IV pilus assembly protein PilA
MNGLLDLMGYSDDGFTLIELMVVVLVIAVLLAVAIPTFLGARTKAQDRAAQSNIRNGLTAEKTYYTDNQAYAASAVSLTAIEPGLLYATGVPSAPGTVGITTVTNLTTNDTVQLVAKSGSGTCFYLQDVEVSNPVGASAGTGYYTDPACGGIPLVGNGAWTSHW